MLKTDSENVACASTSGVKNALEIMSRNREIVLPPKAVKPEGRVLRGNLAVRNKLLDMLQSMNLGWNPDVVSSTGENFVKTVADTLWILDPHHKHKQFVDRSCAIPSHFSEFQGFNDWQRKKQKKPQLDQETLKRHTGLLSDYLMQPWFCNQRWQSFRTAIEQLADAMYKYKRYLESHNDAGTSVRSPDESLSLTPITASPKPTESSYIEGEDILISE